MNDAGLDTISIMEGPAVVGDALAGTAVAPGDGLIFDHDWKFIGIRHQTGLAAGWYCHMQDLTMVREMLVL